MIFMYLICFKICVHIVTYVCSNVDSNRMLLAENLFQLVTYFVCLAPFCIYTCCVNFVWKFTLISVCTHLWSQYVRRFHLLFKLLFKALFKFQFLHKLKVHELPNSVIRSLINLWLTSVHLFRCLTIFEPMNYFNSCLALNLVVQCSRTISHCVVM